MLSSNYSLSFILGQNLLNIPKFMLSKQKFPLILPLSKYKALPILGSYLFSLDRVSFLAQSFASQVEYYELQQHIYVHSFSFLYFSSQQSQFQVPTIEPFVGTGAYLGFNASTSHQQNPNYWRFRQHL
jgi:hypothetical protein